MIMMKMRGPSFQARHIPRPSSKVLSYNSKWCSSRTSKKVAQLVFYSNSKPRWWKIITTTKMMRTKRKKNWMLTSPKSFKSSNFNSKSRVLATKELNKDAKSSSCSRMMKMRRTRKMKARRVKMTKKWWLTSTSSMIRTERCCSSTSSKSMTRTQASSLSLKSWLRTLWKRSRWTRWQKLMGKKLSQSRILTAKKWSLRMPGLEDPLSNTRSLEVVNRLRMTNMNSMKMMMMGLSILVIIIKGRTTCKWSIVRGMETLLTWNSTKISWL